MELSQYSKSGSMFSSSKPASLENALCLCLPVRPAQAVPECCPKILGTGTDFSLNFQSNALIGLGDCQMTCTGLNLDSNLNSAA